MAGKITKRLETWGLKTSLSQRFGVSVAYGCVQHVFQRATLLKRPGHERCTRLSEVTGHREDLLIRCVLFSTCMHCAMTKIVSRAPVQILENVHMTSVSSVALCHE